MKKTAKKAFVWFAVVFTIVVMIVSALTTLLVNHIDTITSTRTVTCTTTNGCTTDIVTATDKK